MQHVNHILPQLSKPHSETVISETPQVRYFYQQLKAIYLAEYDRAFPDPRLIEVSKRTWAKELNQYNREQMDKGLAWVKQQQINLEDGWQFMNIGRCVGAIKQANRVLEAHKVNDLLRIPPPKRDKEKCKERMKALREIVN